MNYDEIRDKVIALVHGRDGQGNWLLPYDHDRCCGWCDRLTLFVDGLLKEDKKVPMPLGCDCYTCVKERVNEDDLTFRAKGAHSQYPERR